MWALSGDFPCGRVISILDLVGFTPLRHRSALLRECTALPIQYGVICTFQIVIRDIINDTPRRRWTELKECRS
jgi:hypothetical protein